MLLLFGACRNLFLGNGKNVTRQLPEIQTLADMRSRGYVFGGGSVLFGCLNPKGMIIGFIGAP